MEDSKIVCIGCPKGCQLNIKHDGKIIKDISGYTCKNGLEYGKTEFTAPKRIVTSAIRVRNGDFKTVSVKTSKAIDKDKIFDVMEEVRKIEISAPVSIQDVILKDVCGTGANIVATNNIRNL